MVEPGGARVVIPGPVVVSFPVDTADQPKVTLSNAGPGRHSGLADRPRSRAGETTEPTIDRAAVPPEDQALLSAPADVSFQLEYVRRVARGGIGDVFEAVQYGAAGFAKRVAVKEIRSELLRRDEVVSMFVREARVLATMVHQHVVQLYHLGRSGDRLFMVMEYVHGVNVEDLIERHRQLGRPVPPALAVYIASRVARALEYVHKRRRPDGSCAAIVHRDVSPRNLLIDSEGVVKLADFGIAQTLEVAASDDDPVVRGKPQYMSPEQVAGQHLDQRSDIFSLGTVLVEMLTLETPFSGRSWRETATRLTRHVEDPLSSVAEELPERLAEIVHRMLQRDALDRLGDSSAVASLLELQIYRSGYGPTFTTLADHLHRLFPDLGPAPTGDVTGPSRED